MKNGQRREFGPQEGIEWDIDEWMDIVTVKRVAYGVPDLKAHEQFLMHQVEDYGPR